MDEYGISVQTFLRASRREVEYKNVKARRGKYTYHHLLAPIRSAALGRLPCGLLDLNALTMKLTTFHLDSVLLRQRESSRIKASMDQGATVQTRPMNGIRCPRCKGKGQEVWVIPGTRCHKCGHPC